MVVRSRKERWYFVLLISVVSVGCSLFVTAVAAPNGLEGSAVIPALLVPLAIAPPTSFWLASYILRIHELNRKLEYLLRHDQMTGLLTRGALFEWIEDQADDVRGAVLMCDIDHFKSINDTYGHRVGDVAIRQVADILKELVSPEGAVARFGGEEFVGFWPGIDIEQAEFRANVIRHAVESQSIQISGEELKFTMSVGLDLFDGTRSFDDVLNSADEFLYQAKDAGRNRVVSRARARGR